MGRKRAAICMAIAVIGLAGAAFGLLAVRRFATRKPIIQGAVIRRDGDPRKETPIPDVLINASYRGSIMVARSDKSGYFRIVFPGTVLPGQAVSLTFNSPNYAPLDLQDAIPFRSSLRRLVIAKMTPEASPARPDATHPLTIVKNVRVRYTVNFENVENIGSAVKTFEVVNREDIPCHRQQPCSPDGYWKASSASIEIDAGQGNEFRDARASCIAGPCPFTRIDSSRFANGGRTIAASAIAWSGTATFLLQAEVFHTASVSNMRESYPVVFGSGFNFTVPPAAEGVSLIAELNGLEIVFPLGPDANLSWATCAARHDLSAQVSSVYQCELKTGFGF